MQKSKFLFCCLVGVLLAAPVFSEDVLSEIEEIDPEDLSQTIIDFVNLTTTPGVGGAVFEVDQPDRDMDLLRGDLGFGTEFSISDKTYNGYWGLALVEGRLEDTIDFTNDSQQSTQARVERDMRALQGSVGLSFPLTDQLRYRPYGSISRAKIDTQSEVTNSVGQGLLTEFYFLESETESTSTSLTQELLYENWLGKSMLELSGQYTVAYTDTDDETDESLDTFGWSYTGVLRARWSAPTKWTLDGKPWWWNTYYNHVNFIGQEKQVMGFKYYHELGVGLDYEMRIKPLDWFGVRFVGIKMGGIFGDDLRGASVGLTFR